VGLEVHQQLDTSHKLFCHCPTNLDERFEATLSRYLRPSLSELGEVDPAALFEWEKGKIFNYQVSHSSCLVEADEEPPHELNAEALETAIAVTKALHGDVVDEVYVMRKIVIDGSNTTGFQRTAIVGIGGYVDDQEGRIGIQTIALEEDAARKVKEGEGEVTYNLDRLGIPLIEISTAPDIRTPEQAERVALRIGQLMRLTGKAKRGIGTIRQDLNVSITGGQKIEIKGVQKLEAIPKVVFNECLRQFNLLRISEELQRRGLDEDSLRKLAERKDLTHLFLSTNSKLVRKQLDSGSKVMGLRLKRMGGILGTEVSPGRRFGTEIADYVRVMTGLGGIFHSEELPNYGITNAEVEAVKRSLEIEDQDAFVLVVGDYDRAKRALDVVLERAVQALKGVPKETRAALEDGNTRFLRPQPGSARMYPETDIPPIRIKQQILEEALKLVPESPEVKLRRLTAMGLSLELAKAMLNNIRLDLFERLVKKYTPSVQPVVIATTLENTLKFVRSKGGDISLITDEVLERVIEALSKGLISKDSIQEILLDFSTSKLPLNEVISKFSVISDEELEKLVRKIVEGNSDEVRRKGEKAFGSLMGKVMGIVRGRADGSKVAEIIKREISKILSQ